MTNPPSKDVDSYIADSSIQARPILEELRKIIKSTVPKVQESINWGFPFYKYNGILAHFAEYKNHIALGFGSDLQSKDIEILKKKGYETGQKRILIKFDQKVPAEEIKKILKAQVGENDGFGT
jgi:uncharacterized protein YdhG (YjbR/CyaY superfamily)